MIQNDSIIRTCTGEAAQVLRRQLVQIHGHSAGEHATCHAGKEPGHHQRLVGRYEFGDNVEDGAQDDECVRVQHRFSSAQLVGDKARADAAKNAAKRK